MLQQEQAFSKAFLKIEFIINAFFPFWYVLMEVNQP
jgi:hypothetical protein